MKTTHDLTVRDVAETLAVHPNTVYSYCQRGEFPNAYRLPGDPRRAEWRIPEDDLTALKARSATKPAYDAKRTRRLLANL